MECNERNLRTICCRNHRFVSPFNVVLSAVTKFILTILFCQSSSVALLWYSKQQRILPHCCYQRTYTYHQHYNRAYLSYRSSSKCEHYNMMYSSSYPYPSLSSTSLWNRGGRLQQEHHIHGGNRSDILTDNDNNFPKKKDGGADNETVSIILSKYGLTLPPASKYYKNKKNRRGIKSLLLLFENMVDNKRKQKQHQIKVLPGATNERRVLLNYILMNILQIIFFRCVATVTKNRLRFQVNVVRWVVISSLVLLFQFYSQILSCTTHNTWGGNSGNGGDDGICSPTYDDNNKIGPYGLIKEKYPIIAASMRIEEHQSRKSNIKTPIVASLQNVPGGGSCLFNAIAACLIKPPSLSETMNQSVTTTGTTIISTTERGVSQSYYWGVIKKKAKQLRSMAVNRLDVEGGLLLPKGAHIRSRNDHNATTLVLEGTDIVPTVAFTNAVAAKYGMTSYKYCQSMKRSSCWGGAPEVIALSNTLRRPICLYHLVRSTGDNCSDFYSSATLELSDNSIMSNKTTGTTNTCLPYGKFANRDEIDVSPFFLECKACYGVPVFGTPCKEDALHILCADSRFPYLDTDAKDYSLSRPGNHFFAVYPMTNNQVNHPVNR